MYQPAKITLTRLSKLGIAESKRYMNQYTKNYAIALRYLDKNDIMTYRKYLMLAHEASATSDAILKFVSKIH